MDMRARWRTRTSYARREGNGNPLQYSCLVHYHPWGHKKSDTTEWLTYTHARRTAHARAPQGDRWASRHRMLCKTPTADLRAQGREWLQEGLTGRQSSGHSGRLGWSEGRRWVDRVLEGNVERLFFLIFCLPVRVEKGLENQSKNKSREVTEKLFCINSA